MYDLGRTHSILFMVDGIWIWMHMFTLKRFGGGMNVEWNVIGGHVPLYQCAVI